MKITITLPMNHPETTIRDLLEKEWLVPRKVRHFLRIRKNVWINQQPALFHHEVKGNDQITLLFEETVIIIKKFIRRCEAHPCFI